MAWEDFYRHGHRGMSGDEPVEEMRLALGRIAETYKDRYGRNPSIHEVLHALMIVLRTDAAAYIEGPAVVAAPGGAGAVPSAGRD